MKGRAAKGMLAAAIVAGLFPVASRAEAPGGARAGIVPREALVRFEPGASPAARAAALASVGARAVRTIRGIGWTLVRLPADASVGDAVATLAAESAVARAEPNRIARIQLDPNDPCIVGCGTGRQWNVDAVNARGGWSVAPGRFYTSAEKLALATPRIKVAVLDTKIDVAHPDFLNRDPLPVARPYDAASGGQLGMADAIDIIPSSRWTGSADYHGTFVAGILGASAHNGAGIAGLGYRAELIPITVVDGNGVATAADVADGIMHAKRAGARVINLSLGLIESSDAVQDAIHAAQRGGALVVAAAGNASNDKPFFPAWHDGVVSVSATDEADRRAPCSNFGHVSVAAPGMGILSLDPRASSKYSVAGCGTSTATPHVSALAALLFAQDPSRTPSQVRQIIERSADDDRFYQGRDVYFGEGRINFARALRPDAPQVDRVIASVPRALGGSSRFTARAIASSDRPIREVEWFVDSVGAPGTGGPLVPADGTWGGLTEEIEASIEVPLVFPTGVHRLFVRARDDDGWGPASVGVLIADRGAPVVKDLTVSPVASGVAMQPLVMSFEAKDDWASVLEARYVITSQVTGAVVHASEPVPILPGRASLQWTPTAATAGPHTVEVILHDEAGNPGRARAGTILA